MNSRTWVTLTALLISAAVVHHATVDAYRPDGGGRSQAVSLPSSPLRKRSPQDDKGTPPKPPECFNCLLQSDKCINYAACDSYTGHCLCAPGFGGFDCKIPLCGTLADGGDRPPRQPGQEECDCGDGWTGVNCNVCTRDDVCRKLVDPTGAANTTGVCYKGRKLIQNSYNACSIKNERLLNLLNGREVNATFECTKENETCRMEFWVNHAESFFCQFDECKDVQFSKPSANFTNLSCNRAKCQCIPNAQLCGEDGSIDLSELFDEVKGPASLSCRDPGFSNGRYNCEFDEPIFRQELGPVLGNNPVIELSCVSGECIHESRMPGYTEPTKEASTTTTIILICMGVAAFGSSLFLLLWLIAKHRRNQLYLALSPSDVDGESEKLMGAGHHIPATIIFRNVAYDIARDQQGYRRVLRGVHGIVKPGEVMAIMGSSGAGKTTCLDILAGKSKRGVVSGDILVNGSKATREMYKRISGYVDQEDAMLDTLTVYETLRYSALLRLPRTMSLAAKEKRVQEAMLELGIAHIANSRVGSGGHRGISGGEKRRVAIAMELVTSPSILFLDEPTSGLDSYNAQTVVQSLVALAKQYNRTVVLTIHQPRSDIFAMFDRLLLLAEGGFMVYSGPVFKPSPKTVGQGDAQDEPDVPVLAEWLHEMGVDCPTGYNLADYLIDLTKVDGGGESALSPSSRGFSKPQSLRHRAGYSRTDDEEKARLSQENGSDHDYDEEHKSPPVPASQDSIATTSTEVPISLTGSPSGGKLRMRTLPPSPVIRTLAAKPEHLHMDPADHVAVSAQRPQLVHLVMGFLKSDVCRDVQAEIAQSLASYVPSAPPSPVFTRAQGSSSSSAPPVYDSPPPPPPVAAMYRAPAPEMSASLKPSSWTQFRVLSGRSFINFYRNPYLMMGHYTLSVVTGLVCGLLFWQVSDNVSGFQNRLGVMFFQLTLLGLSSLSVLELFAKERTIFVRERAGGFYNVTIYFITKVLFDVVPLRVVPPLILSCISYFMIGLVADGTHFFKFILAMVLFNLTTASMCLVIAVSTSDLGVANLIGVMTMLFSMLFSGFLLNKVNLQAWIRWVLYISPFNYALEAVLGNEMKDISLIDRQLGIPIQVPGSVLMKAFGLDALNYWVDVGYLSLLFAGFLVLAYILMQLFVREQR